jgi:hypothetical protein
MGQGYRERRYRLKFPGGIFPLGISVSIERPLTREGPIQWRPATRGAAGREGGYRAAPPAFCGARYSSLRVTRVMAKNGREPPRGGGCRSTRQRGIPKGDPRSGFHPPPLWGRKFSHAGFVWSGPYKEYVVRLQGDPEGVSQNKKFRSQSQAQLADGSVPPRGRIYPPLGGFRTEGCLLTFTN